MQLIDWLLIGFPLLLVLGIGLYTRRYMTSVAGFLSGDRIAGRYLLAVANGEIQTGAVVFVAAFEILSKAGFTMTWWGWLSTPVFLIMGTIGWVIYRYRETRAMTLAQFFEIRYSRGFRLFTGMLGFIAGIANFGIIPSVSARFFVIFFGLPQEIHVFSFTIPTFVPLMAVFLGITLMVALSGGFLTVMLTNCVEGIISQLLYLVIIAFLITKFNWTEINQVLVARPPGQSMLNPFDSFAAKDFNIWYVLMGIFGSIYGTMAWQYNSAYNAAGRTAHESRMAGILGGWRAMGKGAVVTLLGICALTFLGHPDFASQAAHVGEQLSTIADPNTREQMRVPVALSQLLDPGIKGALCVILLMGVFGGDATHLHSWGGIFVQDVLVPLRKKPFTPRQHILLLRLSITGVAIFAFLFGSLLKQTEYIVMWWAVTGAIFISGAGSAIIGGLYWKKGTTAAAWASMFTGAVLCITGIAVRTIYGDRFPLNGIQISFAVSLLAAATYIITSLLTCRENFNLQRMLHRGEYAKLVSKAVEEARPEVAKTSVGKIGGFSKFIGIDSDFSRADRWIAIGLNSWGFFWAAVFLIGTAWNLIAPWPLSAWSMFWHVAAVGLPILMALITGLWFTWGGTKDVVSLFRDLKKAKTNDLDNGMVVNHHNIDEK